MAAKESSGVCKHGMKNKIKFKVVSGALKKLLPVGLKFMYKKNKTASTNFLRYLLKELLAF